MSTVFSKLKDVDDRSRKITLGYIRRIERLISSNHAIPMDIKNLCLIYYFIKEKWDKKLKHPSIMIDGDSVFNKHAQNSAFLSNIVDKGIAVWTIRFDQIGTGRNWRTFGIRKVNTMKIDHNDFTYFEKREKGFSYIYDRGQLSSITNCGCYGDNYGTKCEVGDVIQMTLNMNDLTLSYQVNGKDYGKAFENIENTAYRAAVTMENDTKVTLVKYEQI